MTAPAQKPVAREPMRRCDQCDNRIIKGWGFCPYCGWPLTDVGLDNAQREISAKNALTVKLAEALAAATAVKDGHD
jgi:hypothetical protein